MALYNHVKVIDPRLLRSTKFYYICPQLLTYIHADSSPTSTITRRLFHHQNVSTKISNVTSAPEEEKESYVVREKGLAIVRPERRLKNDNKEEAKRKGTKDLS